MTGLVERDGVTLAYSTAGLGDPPIVFVHGWSCDQSYFAPQIDHFARRHATAALDLRGHGASGVPDPGVGVYDIETFADDVLAVAAEAGFNRPVVIGHSLGGVIALECATRPDAVRAAVMVDPAPILNAPIKAFIGQAADAIEDDVDGSWREAFVKGMFLPTDTVRRDEIIRGMTTLPPAVAAAAIRSIDRFDGAAAFAAATVPVLSIGSAFPSDSAAEFHTACKTITVGQTVGAGHFNQLEVPEQVNVMIERFLAVNGLSTPD